VDKLDHAIGAFEREIEKLGIKNSSMIDGLQKGIVNVMKQSESILA
jgi:hypothetical protein